MKLAESPGDAKHAELVLLSTLHRVSVVPSAGRVSECDLDARIAERLPFGVARITYPTRPLIGPNARPEGTFDLHHTDIRQTFALVRAGDLKPGRPIDADPGDEHMQAMAATPFRTSVEPEPWGAKWAHRIVGLALVAMLVVVACDYLGWAHLLPGSRL